MNDHRTTKVRADAKQLSRGPTLPDLLRDKQVVSVVNPFSGERAECIRVYWPDGSWQDDAVLP